MAPGYAVARSVDHGHQHRSSHHSPGNHDLRVHSPHARPFRCGEVHFNRCLPVGHRVTLGVGIGWQNLEFELTGQDFKNRGKRTDEALEVIQKLMSGKMVDHQGDFYNFPSVQMSPAPTSPLPIYVGGHSEKALRRAARHSGWLGLGYAEPDITKLIRRLQSLRQETGLQDEPYDIWLALLNPDKTDFNELEDLGVTSLSGAHFMQGGRAAPSPPGGQDEAHGEFCEAIYPELRHH